MKIKICSYIKGGSEKYRGLCARCSELNAEYAEKHGYAYSYDDIAEDIPDNYRFRYMLSQMKKCDYLVCVDADAAFVTGRKLEDLIDEVHGVFISQEYNRALPILSFTEAVRLLLPELESDHRADYIVNFGACLEKLGIHENFMKLAFNPQAISPGFIILKNTKEVRDMLKEADSLQQYFSRDKFQTALGMLINTKYSKTFTLLPNGVQGHVNGVEESRFDPAVNYVMHNYRLGVDAKTAALDRYLAARGN